jgi:RNA polymerase sigma-70 factor, ECF subfamily
MPNFKEFNKYYKQTMSQVFGFVYLRCGQNNAITEDLVSEIFLKAIEHFDKFDKKKGTFKSWIFKIARNHLADHFKSPKNKAKKDIDAIANKIKDNSDSKKNAEQSLEGELIASVLKTLKKDKQELIALRYYSGYSFKEISKIIGDSENLIRVKVHRILKNLKTKLKHLRD